MRTGLTDKEIRDKFEDVFKKARYGEEPDKITIVSHPHGYDIEFQRMYSSPQLSLPMLIVLSKFFETDNIESRGQYARGGCETCDYGSEYGFTLEVRE